MEARNVGAEVETARTACVYVRWARMVRSKYNTKSLNVLWSPVPLLFCSKLKLPKLELMLVLIFSDAGLTSSARRGLPWSSHCGFWFGMVPVPYRTVIWPCAVRLSRVPNNVLLVGELVWPVEGKNDIHYLYCVHFDYLLSTHVLVAQGCHVIGLLFTNAVSLNLRIFSFLTAPKGRCCLVWN